MRPDLWRIIGDLRFAVERTSLIRALRELNCQDLPLFGACGSASWQCLATMSPCSCPGQIVRSSAVKHDLVDITGDIPQLPESSPQSQQALAFASKSDGHKILVVFTLADYSR